MPVTTERSGRVLVITLVREDKRNALNAELTRGLDRALNELEDSPDLWCGILTGGRRFFSAGADLAAGPGDPTPRGGVAGLIHRDRVKPLIAAVEGFALGGGMELVLCCDMVVAASDARFGLSEVKRGLMPDFGGAFRVVSALPANIAREILLTGDDLTAERAERLGFVNRLVPPGTALDGAFQLAARVCANAPLATRAALSVSAKVARGAKPSCGGTATPGTGSSSPAKTRRRASACSSRGVLRTGAPGSAGGGGRNPAPGGQAAAPKARPVP